MPAPALAHVTGRGHLADFLLLVLNVCYTPFGIARETVPGQGFCLFLGKGPQDIFAVCYVGQKQSGLLDDLSSNEVLFLHSENVWFWFDFLSMFLS